MFIEQGRIYRDSSKKCRALIKADRSRYFADLSERAVLAFESSSWNEASKMIDCIFWLIGIVANLANVLVSLMRRVRLLVCVP